MVKEDGGPARRSQWPGRNLRLAGSLIKKEPERATAHHATNQEGQTKDEERETSEDGMKNIEREK